MSSKWRPVKVLFIGDEPSSKNVDPAVPFVGTASYKRLLKWIGELDLDIQNVQLLNTDDEIRISSHITDKVVFLGKKSCTLLKFISYGVNVPNPGVKIIDHPSPRNSNFNNPGYEKKMLKELKEWIYE